MPAPAHESDAVEAKIETVDKILKANAGNEAAFPKTVVKGIWDNVLKGSVTQQLAGSVPVSINGTAIPIPVGQPTAGIVAEGGLKPVATLASKVKTVTPVKAAVMILFSEETAKADPLGEYSRIQKALGEAIARAIDTAIIHGIDATTGTAITGKESLVSTTKNTVIDPAQTAPGYLTKQLSAAYDSVVLDDADEAEYGFDHFLFAPKFRSSLVNALDAQGRPLYQSSPDITAKFGTVMGVPTTYSRAVSGYEKAKTGAAKLLGIGGDFKDALRLGFVETITYRKATERAGGVDLFDRNMGAILAEAQFGWVLRDPKAFTKITLK
ncbi:MAG: phage major capsid protein [Rothia mucilaginosa]|uniref:Phage major capsid protein n=1 Tax=Rothia mucilaginosa TaxID=43675 RepID=A0A930LAT0_9MICC|nr:phage major capsid protein [Rothia mucilaginosa]MBF1659572.1 phage major capsid protein [Rothia mucilaginosa]